MPIKNLSDRRRFTRIGKIRIGEKVKRTKDGRTYEYPQKLDYFIPQAAPDVEARFNELYGEKPRSLRIAFPSEDRELICPQYYKLYDTNGLKCKGTGEHAGRVSTDGKLELLEVECQTPQHCDYCVQKDGKPGCKQIMNLQFMLVDFDSLSVWQLDTSSVNSIININSALDKLQFLAGRVSMVPINLVVRPRETKEPNSGKRVTIYELDLDLGVGLSQLNLLKPITGGLSLPAPDESTPDALYPTSQIGLPAPAEDYNAGHVNEDTGEIYEGETEQEPPSEPADLF